jgi:hypothetical protein
MKKDFKLLSETVLLVVEDNVISIYTKLAIFDESEYEEADEQNINKDDNNNNGDNNNSKKKKFLIEEHDSKKNINSKNNNDENKLFKKKNKKKYFLFTVFKTILITNDTNIAKTLNTLKIYDNNKIFLSFDDSSIKILLCEELLDILKQFDAKNYVKTQHKNNNSISKKHDTTNIPVSILKRKKSRFNNSINNKNDEDKIEKNKNLKYTTLCEFSAAFLKTNLSSSNQQTTGSIRQNIVNSSINIIFDVIKCPWHSMSSGKGLIKFYLFFYFLFILFFIYLFIFYFIFLFIYFFYILFIHLFIYLFFYYFFYIYVYLFIN